MIKLRWRGLEAPRYFSRTGSAALLLTLDMIGNDIVDLPLARKESNWQRPRFLDKIFTEEEQHFIHNSRDKEVAVWLLWSGKESVYKIVARLEKRQFFAPKKIKHDFLSTRNRRDRACPVPTITSGKEIVSASYQEYNFSVQSEVTNTHIHTIAQFDDNKQSPISNLFHIKKNNYKTQHETTREYLLKNYAKMTNLAVADLRIQKDEWNIPHIYYQNKKQSAVISISHHGHYGGYAIKER